MKPLSGLTIPRRHFINVVLPDPFGPISAMHWLFRQLTEILSSAFTLRKLFVTLFAIIISYDFFFQRIIFILGLLSFRFSGVTLGINFSDLSRRLTMKLLNKIMVVGFLSVSIE